jgi:hypothetical protein
MGQVYHQRVFMHPTLPQQRALIASMAPERLVPYRRAVGGSERRAVELYLLDAELASQFHAALRAVEVLMRQRMHEELSTTFGSDWYRRLFDKLDMRTKRRIDEAWRGVGRTAPDGKVVAQLMLGTWSGLLDRGGVTSEPGDQTVLADYESLLWTPALARAFTDRGRGAGISRRSDASRLVRSVGWARNRVNHCESVVFGIPSRVRVPTGSSARPLATDEEERVHDLLRIGRRGEGLAGPGGHDPRASRELVGLLDADSDGPDPDEVAV